MYFNGVDKMVRNSVVKMVEKMNLRNYTSTVPASKSVEAIERLLVAAGASHIVRQYVDGGLKGFIFALAHEVQ